MILYGVCLSCCLCVLVCVSFNVFLSGVCGLTFGVVWLKVFFVVCVLWVLLQVFVSCVRGLFVWCGMVCLFHINILCPPCMCVWFVTACVMLHGLFVLF